MNYLLDNKYMAHHKSHIGIPNTLLKSYSEGNQLYAVNLKKGLRCYLTKPENAGVEKDYYDDETENLLSSEIETDLGAFLKELKVKGSMCEKVNFINSKHNILEKFIKFQLQRSKNILNFFNKNSLSSKKLGYLSHSDYIKFISKTESINILSLIEGSIFARVCVATECNSFITNSLGFYVIPDIEQKTMEAVIIPYSSKEAIYISNFDGDLFSHYEVSDKNLYTLNRYCYDFENFFGNGFIFSVDPFCKERYLK